MLLGGSPQKGSYLQAQFHRPRARRGAKKAVGAAAASILTAAYHVIANGTFHQNLGAGPAARQPQVRRIAKLLM
jgi:transposase